MNSILQWIAPTKEQLTRQAEQLKKKMSSYGFKVKWGEPVKITEQSMTRHDRMIPYDGFLLEVVIEKGAVMDWREQLKVINSVQSAYRLFNE